MGGGSEGSGGGGEDTCYGRGGGGARGGPVAKAVKPRAVPLPPPSPLYNYSCRFIHARSRLCGPRGRWACRLLPQTPVDPNPAPPRIRCLSQSLNSRSPLEARTTSGPPPKPSRVVKGTATRLPTRAPAGHVASAGRTPLGCGHSAPPPRVRRHPRPCAWAAKGGNGRARRDGGRCGGGHDRSGGGGDKRRRRGGQRRARGR